MAENMFLASHWSFQAQPKGDWDGTRQLGLEAHYRELMNFDESRSCRELNGSSPLARTSISINSIIISISISIIITAVILMTRIVNDISNNN